MITSFILVDPGNPLKDAGRLTPAKANSAMVSSLHVTQLQRPSGVVVVKTGLFVKTILPLCVFAPQ